MSSPMSFLQPKPKAKPNHERWMISYADLLTLLLALFIVLYATETPNKNKMVAEEAGFLRAFHGTPLPIVQAQSANQGIMKASVTAVQRPSEPTPTRHDDSKSVQKNEDSQHIPQKREHSTNLNPQILHQMEQNMDRLQGIKNQLQQLLMPLIKDGHVSINNTPLTLTIRLNASVLFKSGDATLTPEADKILAQIGQNMTNLPAPFSIIVQGYTDNQAIQSPIYPSNWQLSADRAGSVVQLFQKIGIDGGQMAAEGFGEFSPIAKNDNPKDMALNRRVEIVIHAPDLTSATNLPGELVNQNGDDEKTKSGELPQGEAAGESASSKQQQNQITNIANSLQEKLVINNQVASSSGENAGSHTNAAGLATHNKVITHTPASVESK